MGENKAFNIHSQKKSEEKKEYELIIFGKKKDIISSKIAFTIVPINPKKAGDKNPFIFTFKWKSPTKKPNIDLIKAFKPKGAPLIKSRKKPEAKPCISPETDPREIPMYIT